MLSFNYTSRAAKRLACVLVATTPPLLSAAHAQSCDSAAASTPLDVAAVIEDAAEGDPAPLRDALARLDPSAPEAMVVRAQLAAMRLDEAATQSELDAFSARADPSTRLAAVAWGIGANVAFAEGDYAAAATLLERAIPLIEALGEEKEVQSAQQNLGVAKLLSAEPRQAVVGGTPGTIATMRDKVGLTRATISINGVEQAAVLDTGANLSVVTQSTAARLGLRMIEGEASVGSSTSSVVATRLAVADTLTIAGVDLHNVAFLVLADDQLEFPLPGGYSIDAIVGFPVFRALGRIDFARNGTFTAGGAELVGDPNLLAAGNDLYVLTAINGIPSALHLDTGASTTALTSIFGSCHADLVATLPRKSRNIAGAGGMVAQQVALWGPADIVVGGRSTALPQVQIVVEGETASGSERLGTLGQDVLGAFASYALDFRTMRFEFGEAEEP